MAKSSRDVFESRASAWEAEARQREQQASRNEGEFAKLSATARQMLKVQANVYRACAKDLRDAARTVSRG